MSVTNDEYWQTKAEELGRTSLDTVRASATASATATTALIGVVSTVAVVKGPDSLDKLSDPWGPVVAVLISLAAVTAFASVGLTAWAGRGALVKVAALTGPMLEQWTRDRADAAVRGLRRGQLAGLLAAVLVLAAGLVAVLAGELSPAGDPTYLVRTNAGAVECGQLSRRDGGRLVLSDDSGKALLGLDSGVASVTAVASCPTPAQ